MNARRIVVVLKGNIVMIVTERMVVERTKERCNEQ